LAGRAARIYRAIRVLQEDDDDSYGWTAERATDAGDRYGSRRCQPRSGGPLSAALSAEVPALTPPGAGALKELMGRLDKAPRRRSFKTVPMILTEPDQWDDEALSEVLAYKPRTKHAWDMTDMAGPWLNLINPSSNP
jgi:hypothetical protein